MPWNTFLCEAMHFHRTLSFKRKTAGLEVNVRGGRWWSAIGISWVVCAVSICECEVIGKSEERTWVSCFRERVPTNVRSSKGWLEWFCCSILLCSTSWVKFCCGEEHPVYCYKTSICCRVCELPQRRRPVDSWERN